MLSFKKELTDPLLQASITFSVNMGSKYQPDFFARFDEVALLFAAARPDHPECQVRIMSAKRESDRWLQPDGFNQFIELGLGEAVNLKGL